ncbi:retrovirus-related pol polyprotein from transposon TNT 1-94 [Tanacetum coccineum]|uniref:Retrovirus-related pol polyprotein from transposon TNT 1-94 n=1 Tax=Tanacetum coccineum TaxID=301880 RepID=A0ABQ5CAF3_9ASTR
MQLSQLQETRSNADHTLAFRALDSQITQLTRKVTVLQEQNELFRAENEKIKQHYKELYDSIKITCAKHIEQITALLTENENLKVQIQNKMTCVTKDHVKPKVLAPGVNSCTDASGSQPRSNTKNNRILPAKSVNMKKVEDHPRTIKSSMKIMNHVNSSISSKRTVVQIVLWYLDAGYSKHMTGDRSRLMNFVKKFIGTVRFENDHFGAIMGYGDYMISDSVISKVKFLRSKDETPEVIIKFLKQIQVGLNKTVRYICTDNGTEFVNKDLTDYYERVGIFHQKTVLRTPQQNGVVERRNRTLVEASQTMLIFSKAPMFLWVEVVATACYTQNRSLIHTRHDKTPYELVHNKKPDLTFFHVFGALCYPTNDSEDLGKLQPTADIGIFVGYAPSRNGLAPIFFTPGQISLGLVQNPVPAAPYVPPINKDPEILFQLMFDEYLEPPRVKRLVSPTPAVPAPVNSASTPSSTTIDQDAPSLSHSPLSSVLQSPSLQQGVAAEPTIIDDTHFAPINNNPFVNVFAPEHSSKASSSRDFSSA